MTSRQARLGANLFTAAVVLSVSAALAGLTWRLAGDPGERLAATPVAAKPAPPADISALIGFAPFGSGAPTSAASADANVILRGVMMAEPHSASAALISVGGALPTAFYEGGQVAGGTISAIAADHVEISVGSERRILSFPDRGAAGAGGSTSTAGAVQPNMVPPASAPAINPPPPPTPGAAPASGGNPQSLLAGLGATPTPDGFRVATPSAQMRSAGLQPGDVVQRINGQAMVDLMTNPAALQTAFVNGTARVDVIRAGQPLTLSIPLR